jgi:predicted MFS family arabinose efflux permease
MKPDHLGAAPDSRSNAAADDPRALSLRTARLLVAYGGLHMVLFPIPVITLFWKDQIGMSLADVMLLQAIFALAAVALEFPSGYAADRLGHRASLLISAILWIAGWLLYASGTTFAGMAVAEVVLGAGLAFASGADSALLFTSLQTSGKASEYPRWEGRARAAGQASEATSSALGGYFYSLSPRLPLWLQLPAALLAFGTVAAMRAPPRVSGTARVSHLTQAWWIVRHTLLHHPRLRSAVLLSVVLGLSTFVMVWLIQPYMQSRGIPEAWFGPLWAGAHVYLALISLLSARAAERLGRDSVLLASCVLIPLGYGALACSSSAGAVAFYLCFMTVRGLQGPLLLASLQRDAPDDARASVLSLNALLFRLSFVLVGPPVGVLVDRLGLDSALALLGVAFCAAALLALGSFRRAHAAC